MTTENPTAPAIADPTIAAPTIAAPTTAAPTIAAPTIAAPTIAAPDPAAPDPAAPDPAAAAPVTTPVTAPTPAPADDATTMSNIAERLSFFFSNANTRADRFMQKELVREDTNDFGGAIQIETLLRFKSIQQYTEDATKVMEVAKTLLAELLVVNEEKKTLSRKVPMTKDQMDDNIPLSLHVSNLAVENNKYVVTATDDIRPLFEVYGKVALVKMKWKPDFDSDNNGEKRRKMIPTGSCLVEFETVEEVSKAAADLVPVNVTVGEGEAAASTTTPAVKTLELKTKTLEVDKLVDWIASRKAGKKEKGTDSKKRKAAEPAVPIEIKEFVCDWKPACVIQLKGLDKEKCDRECIRAVVDNVIPGLDKDALYADYSRGQDDGAVRFSEPNEAIAKLAAQINSGEVEVAGSKVGSAFVLEGEAEKAYWNNFIEFKNKQIRHKAEEKANKRSRRR